MVLKGSAVGPHRLWIVGFSLLIAAAGLSAINGQVVGLYHDDGIYAAVAKSLAEGEGYRIGSLPTTPAQTKYPFLYSLVLSFIWKIAPTFPENLFLLKAFNVACLVGIFILSFVFYIRKVPSMQRDALLCAILVVFNPAVFSFAEFLLSDILFSLLILLVLAFFSEIDADSSSRLRVALFASLIGLIFLTKPAGFPLAIAGALGFIFRRHYRSLLVYAVVWLIVVSPWFMWIAVHSGDVRNALFSYYVSHDHSHVAVISIWSNPAYAVEIIWANLNYIKDSIGYMVFIGHVPGLSFLTLALLALGLVRSFRKELVFLNSFVLLYIFMVTVWPWHPLRYLLPMVPVVMFLFFQGIYCLQNLLVPIRRLGHWKTVSLAITQVPLLFVLISELVWLNHYLPRTVQRLVRLPYGIQVAYGLDGFAETFDWIKKNTDESAVLATAYDPTYYLYTGRKAIRPGFHKPESYFYPYGRARPNVGLASTVKKNLTELGADYLIIDRIAGFAEQSAQQKLMIELLQLYPRQPDLVFVSQDTFHRVYVLP